MDPETKLLILQWTNRDIYVSLLLYLYPPPLFIEELKTSTLKLKDQTTQFKFRGGFAIMRCRTDPFQIAYKHGLYRWGICKKIEAGGHKWRIGLEHIMNQEIHESNN